MSDVEERLYKLFVHRKDVFAEQQKSGAYFPTRRPITLKDIREHILGLKTIGVYCLDKDNTVKWACVDLDDKINPTALKGEAIQIYNLFSDFGRMLEFSGRKGYHVWIFFKQNTQAKYAQKLVRARLNRIPGANRHEVFPKQTELNESRKFGNLVKLPLAMHRVSGKRSEILMEEGI